MIITQEQKEVLSTLRSERRSLRDKGRSKKAEEWGLKGL